MIFDIEQKRPIVYVVQIALDAPPHLLDRISFSAMAVYLGQVEARDMTINFSASGVCNSTCRPILLSHANTAKI
jgi:hypothetical protein